MNPSLAYLLLASSSSLSVAVLSAFFEGGVASVQVFLGSRFLPYLLYAPRPGWPSHCALLQIVSLRFGLLWAANEVSSSLSISHFSSHVCGFPLDSARELLHPIPMPLI